MEIGIREKPDLFGLLCLNDQWATEIANRLKVGDMLGKNNNTLYN